MIELSSPPNANEFETVTVPNDATVGYSRGATTEPVCANCGANGVRKFCPDCGQEVAPRIAPIGNLAKELAGELFSFDGRLFRTLRFLFTRPGFLTVEYCQGRRIGYIAPLRLYFWATALFLLAFSSHGQKDFQAQMHQSFSASFSRSTAPVAISTSSASSASPRPASTPAPKSAKSDAKSKKGSALERRIERRMGACLAWYSSHMDVLSGVLIPVTAWQLGLLYRRRRRLYIEHLIFTLNTQAFIMLVNVPMVLLTNFSRWGTLCTMATYLPYQFCAQRRVYGGGVFKTLLKTVLAYAGLLAASGMLGALLAVAWILWPGDF